ncbi:baculoviral IAP repeat-containing protein 8-like [Diabrotica undecimpunctata]|uniref:baculoviral IAP repeat-containing protein 8-like n=1 Tax=Diabrotica undecimpunctata TaxID=50387 RepID=UPI003B6346A5
MITAHLLYPVIIKRLSSFDEWMPSHPIKPIVLAIAGFYYTGVNDKVLCAFCGVVYNKWLSDDITLDKHKHDCCFLIAYKQAQKLWTVEERLKTFTNRNISAKKHAEAGFFYENGKTYYITNKDITLMIVRLTTFHDNGSPTPLRNYSEIRAAPCNFIHTGPFKRTITTDLCIIIDIFKNVEDPEVNANVETQDTEVNREANQLIICKICLSREINTVALPCGHATSCLDCSRLLNNICCLCRTSVECTPRLYI